MIKVINIKIFITFSLSRSVHCDIFDFLKKNLHSAVYQFEEYPKILMYFT